MFHRLTGNYSVERRGLFLARVYSSFLLFSHVSLHRDRRVVFLVVRDDWHRRIKY